MGNIINGVIWIDGKQIIYKFDVINQKVSIINDSQFSEDEIHEFKMMIMAFLKDVKNFYSKYSK